ncbi:MAG: FAD-dependent oxidoreductase [Candidatus Thermoplasmatota archaeon]|nr:FAD-dependent oxidoreductase [Candidatus Thermoplasmatota archaeon]MBU1941541.1 FAD-dependent oxidoreductase [Candidatus Thermoplasmatota archaeon]
MRIIILGGGFCGSTLATYLDRHHNLETILIDKKPYFEYTPSLPKLLHPNNKNTRYIRKYSDFLPHITIKTEEILAITPHYIKTTNHSYNYNYLIICPGSTYQQPFPEEPNIFTIKHGSSIQQIVKEINHCKHLIIIGGGIVGVEVAAELAITYHDKQITLVHPHSKLLERTPPFASRYAQHFLTKHGITILFNEKIQSINNNSCITQKGLRIPMDLGIWCAGVSPPTLTMKNFSSQIITDKHTLVVNEYFQLKEYPNIFVGGDITNIAEEKTALNAERHARYLYHNIIQQIDNKPLKKYHTIPTVLVISLGPKNGIIALPRFVFPGLIPAVTKWVIEKITLLNRT